jgi:hypothetical protein
MASLLISTGCQLHTPGAWDTTGLQAGTLESVWWLFFGVTCVVYAVVLGTLGAAMLRRRDPEIGLVSRTSRTSRTLPQ